MRTQCLGRTNKWHRCKRRCQGYTCYQHHTLHSHQPHFSLKAIWHILQHTLLIEDVVGIIYDIYFQMFKSRYNPGFLINYRNFKTRWFYEWQYRVTTDREWRQDRFIYFLEWLTYHHFFIKNFHVFEKQSLRKMILKEPTTKWFPYGVKLLEYLRGAGEITMREEVINNLCN